MAIRLKRVHEPAAPDDGLRIFVERYWPRDVEQQQCVIHTWVRDLAPSPQTIARFAHRPERWEDFKQRYWDELQRDDMKDTIADLRGQATNGTLTLLYGARSRSHNSALALAEYLAVPVEARPAPLPEPGTVRPRPPDGTRRRVGISPFGWFGLLFALLSPLTSLVIIEFLVIFKLHAWAVLAGCLAAFGIVTTLRSMSRDSLFPRRGNREDREPLWTTLGDLLLPVAATIVAVLAFVGFFEVLLFLGRVMHLTG